MDSLTVTRNFLHLMSLFLTPRSRRLRACDPATFHLSAHWVAVKNPAEGFSTGLPMEIRRDLSEGLFKEDRRCDGAAIMVFD